MSGGRHPAPRPALRPVGDRWEAAVPVASPVGAAWPRAADLVSTGPVPLDPHPVTAAADAAVRSAGGATADEPTAPRKPKHERLEPAGSGKAKSGRKQKKAKPVDAAAKSKSKAKAKVKVKAKAKAGRLDEPAAKPKKLKEQAKPGKQRASGPLTAMPTAAGPHPDRPLTVMLTPEQARRLQRQARDAGRAETHLVAELLDVWLEPR